MTTQGVVLGAGGQVARELRQTQPQAWNVRYLSRDTLDITRTSQLESALAEQGVAWVINAAAYTAVDRAEEQAELAERVNGEAPGALAACCQGLGIRLLHLSTDFVFDGRQSTPYRPDDAINPLSVYGRSKRLGEEAVLAAHPSAVVLRTSWVYSRHGNNFVKTMLRLMAERDQLGVVEDQVGSPTWARGLAEACWGFLREPAAGGIFHWSDAGVCSWFDFAVAIRELALDLGLLQRAAIIVPIDTQAYPTPAVRPAYSVLDKSASRDLLGRPGFHWREQLRAMLTDLMEEEEKSP